MRPGYVLIDLLRLVALMQLRSPRWTHWTLPSGAIISTRKA